MADFCSDKCKENGAICNFCLHFIPINKYEGTCSITNLGVERDYGEGCDFFICFVTKLVKERA